MSCLKIDPAPHQPQKQPGRFGSLIAVAVLSILLAQWMPRSAPATTLDDLKNLTIICLVPSYLPKDFKLKKVEITYDEIEGSEDKEHRFPLYSIEYGNGGKGSFSIESAREGIGDRNIMPDVEDTKETEIPSPMGPMYLIFTPKGKDGRKVEIRSNWQSDPRMKAETAKDVAANPNLGRYHGFSATGITLAEFAKIVDSLHPVRSNSTPAPKPPSTTTSELKLHPKIFSMIDCWLSDSESPVVTEINLDAVEKNGNEFNYDEIKPDGQWTRSPVPNSNGFMRYAVLERKGNRYKVEYQENGGGTLTTDSVMEFTIDKRNIQRNGKPVAIRVLRVTGYQSE